ncbi:flagellar hook-basal body complex protein FliE [Thermoleophilum album]|jgi:flagellar hook-basal body complex protein FliE|uniref:flagellar hook-basal body complex protein FliE n=1 Tax=Thermoleophilum album TaxID=29539 RepID=UPI000CB17E82|nr:flagellar hook-basal body complex protein FliE [Thermoleophilum album]MCL6440371.1 flagellar hook-basal body complex protein FliE [Thermoleophilum sp.]WDT94559.1 flagellar hook-basal body complex protein FliE [Thermoleophilum album]GBD45954.1 Flagellar hook-basal body complex protein FliE [bacterium HR41]
MTPADPVSANEWSIPSVGGLGREAAIDAPAGTQASDFGDLLGRALSALDQTQQNASDAARALATGEADDPTAVVLAVERAQLAMQLANQIRTKAVEAYQEVFRTQV